MERSASFIQSLYEKVGKPVRMPIVASVLCLAVTACTGVDGSPSADDGNLPANAGDAPEGSLTDPDALVLPNGARLSLGDTGLGQPPGFGSRQLEGVPVALMAPLSGPLEGAGKALLRGAEMALFDVSQPAFRLVPLDTKGTVEGTIEAMQEAQALGVEMILGPLLADNVDAIRADAELSGLTVLSFSNSQRVAGNTVLLAGFTPEEQANDIVGHAIGEGRTRFAVLAPSNDYGNAVVDAVREAATSQGAEFSGVAFFDPASLDYSQAIKDISNYNQRVAALRSEKARLRNQSGQAARQALARLEVRDTFGDPPFDALIVPVLQAQTLQILSAQLSVHDVDPPSVMVLGLQRWDSFQNLEAEPGLVGARYPAARSIHKAAFVQRFQSFFGQRPSDLSALGYDITAIAAALAGDGQSTPPRYDLQTLTDSEGFMGIEGLFRFTDSGSTERGFAIVEVRPEGPTVIVDPPTRFIDTVPTS